jgi:type IV secretory pathway VirB10-like protein
MLSKPLAFGLLALGCVTAAAGGAYMATRHNTADVTAGSHAAVPAASPATPAPQPVAETESPVAAEKPAAESPAPDAPAPATAAPARTREKPVATSRRTTPDKPKPERVVPTAEASRPTARTVPVHEPVATASIPAAEASTPPPVAAPAPAPIELPARPDPRPEPPRAPRFEEVVLPAASVIGVQVETALSSERARIEDRVEARVTRDVMANGRVAIPAGSRVLGSVTLVDKGGKVKERARLGIRFHTVVLADGSDLALNTEPFFRDGESPAGDSAKKIGGAAIGGAILGAILGGGKGAVLGGTAGAAGGTAATMAGDRNPATIASGSIVSVRLSSPVTIPVEKREP